MPIDAKMSGRIGLAAFKHSLCTLTSVSSPARVVKSMQDRARHNHAACHCFFTVLRVPKVAARLLMAGKSTLVSFIHASSKAVPGLWTSPPTGQFSTYNKMKMVGLHWCGKRWLIHITEINIYYIQTSPIELTIIFLDWEIIYRNQMFIFRRNCRLTTYVE